ncbi:ABC transporter substrate-binding protein [Bifidobacterium subtile]|uniref:Aliphatic sulfonate ABC transporter substrate-binding protein n=1 Tax=Bifidobacterium subtile TaxID=77635 RepID=A0A087EAK2_9BIFI|nr:ABC transporter substrate-binding protein [Bifidobacterium subtile]KFJ04803.1 aliphatic sulfonate ABC transporter substrate-binding protein [Bifidobacterium subtile]QOL35873.1 ABC transporter substrate-binding protein [Bifidobacterium subtile]
MFAGKRIQKTLAVLTALAMAVTIGACGSSNDSKESNSAADTTVNIAFPTWSGYGPLYIAKEKGYFAEQHLNVNMKIVEGLAERKQALAGGSLDALATAADVIVNLAANDIPMKTTWVLDISNGSDGIVYNKSIKSLKDLKGKQIAVEEGTTDHFFLLKVLQQNGIAESDVKLVNMTTGDAGTAFVGGKVPAAVTYEPYLSQAAAAGGKTYTTKDDPVPLLDVVAFTDGFASKHPAAVKGFSKALAEAAQYAKDNPKDADKIMANGLQMDVADVESTLKVLKIFGTEENIKQFGKEGSHGELRSTMDEYSQFYASHKITPKTINPDDVIDATPVRALQQ